MSSIKVEKICFTGLKFKISLADPHCNVSGKINIILFVDVYSHIMLDGLSKHASISGPKAQRTTLGWILTGKLCKKTFTNQRLINLNLQIKEEPPFNC